MLGGNGEGEEEIYSLSDSESGLEPEFTEVEEQLLPKDSRRELD